MRWVLFLLALAACAPPDGGVGERLADGIAAHAPGDTLDLAALAPFAWDCLHIVEPYTTADAFERQTGVDWPAHWDWGAIGERDDQALLVFTDAGAAVAAVEVSRSVGDLVATDSGALDPAGIARDDARFVVRRGEGGWRTLDAAD